MNTSIAPETISQSKIAAALKLRSRAKAVIDRANTAHALLVAELQVIEDTMNATEFAAYEQEIKATR